MKRRNFVRTSAALLAAPAAAETAKGQIFHLRYYYMRTGTQVDRSMQDLGSAWLPAVLRAGGLHAGLFSPVIDERSQCILSLVSYSSLASFEAAEAKLAEDKDFAKAWDNYNSIGDPACQ